jgi:hypothetical protein
LVGGPPGIELHTVVDGLPSGDTGGTVPVVLPTTIDGARVPNAGALPAAEGVGTAGVPGAICPDGVAQVRTVPGVAGLDASGTGANVVSAVPGWVVAENGLGPLSAEVTIAPGVDGNPIAVLPMVETCARQALQPNIRAVAVNIRRRMANASFQPIDIICGRSSLPS